MVHVGTVTRAAGGRCWVELPRILSGYELGGAEGLVSVVSGAPAPAAGDRVAVAEVANAPGSYVVLGVLSG